MSFGVGHQHTRHVRAAPDPASHFFAESLFLNKRLSQAFRAASEDPSQTSTLLRERSSNFQKSQNPPELQCSSRLLACFQLQKVTAISEISVLACPIIEFLSFSCTKTVRVLKWSTASGARKPRQVLPILSCLMSYG